VELESYWEEKRKLINEAIKDFITANYEGEAVNVSRHILFGGKRLRGVLCLLVCEALGGRAEDALDAAVAIELVHSASLAHDDIIDQTETRRGRPAAWVLFGLAKTVLVPHVLITHGLMMLRKYGLSAVYMALECWNEVARGEIHDVFSGRGFSEGIYTMIAGAKTGALFGLACALGAVAAKKRGWRRIASEYGRALGLAFQVADDIVDASRLRKGDWSVTIINPSLPAFLAYISKGRMEALMKEEKDMVDRALSKLEVLVDRAVRYARQFPESKYRPLLEELPQFAVRKMLSEVQMSFGVRREE